MNHLFLTSTVEWPGVAKSIHQKLGTQKIRMPFILTPAEAPGESEDMSWLEGERKSLREAGFEIFDYSISNKSSMQIQQDLSNIEALYVSGGNEFYFKQECNQNHFDSFVQEFVNRGKPYIGTSAGAIILAKDLSPLLKINDVTHLKQPLDTAGFGIVDFVILPHWGSDIFKTAYLEGNLDILYQTNNQLIALNNFEYIEVVGDKYRIIDVRSEK